MWRRSAIAVLVLVLAAPPVASGHGDGAFAPQRRWSATYDDWEPTVATGPGGRVYQMTTRYAGRRVCGGRLGHCIVFRRSGDGGETWSRARVMPAGPRVRSQNDPQVRVAADGVVYAAWMNDYDVTFARSRTGGRTWTDVTDLRGGLSFSDKPILVISPTGRDVYVAFNASDSYVVASHDFGRTFSRPVRTNRDGRYWFAEGGAWAAGGTVYLAESAEHQSGLRDVELALLRSGDGGRSWQTRILGRSRERPPCPFPDCPVDFYGPQSSVAVGGGAVVYAYAANPTADAPMTMWVRRSTDGGRTWSPPSAAAHGGTAVGADFPELAYGRGGLRLAWQDDRNGPAAWNTWLARSHDSGRTWSRPVRLSRGGAAAAYSSRRGYRFPYGDFFGLAVSAAGRTYAVWGAGPGYDGPGGTWFTRD